MLQQPPNINQLTLVPNGSNDCGEACVWMACHVNDIMVNIQDILAAHSGVSDLPTILSLCRAFGLLDCYITYGSFDPNVDYVIALIHDDNQANPNVAGPNEHYILGYGEVANMIQCNNPYGGRTSFYPLSQFDPAYIGAVIIPPQQKDDDMANNVHAIDWPQKSQQHVLRVDLSGKLHNNWRSSTSAGKWGTEEIPLPEPMNPKQGSDVLMLNGTLQIHGEGILTGRPLHAWQGAEPTWQAEYTDGK